MWTRFWLWLQTRLGQDPRGLFVYFDGRRWRSADPLQLARQLFTHPEFDWDETPQLLLTARASIQLEAFRIIGDAVRTAFRIDPVERGGLTDRECLDLLTAFRTYLGDVKKNGSLFPTSLVFTELNAAVGSTTKPVSDCGSTPTEPSSGPPGLPAEQTFAR
ncbi:MAG: hypothetical protein JSS49_19025 [Planctomycetes bacterium]|nr:hypothetical protein [Planctomycetota bacterium]